MKIKTFHAFFTLPTTGNGLERIGFSVGLEEGDTPESAAAELRERAIKIVGKRTYDLYQERSELKTEIEQLEQKLDKLRKEWDATAEFLKAQGLNPVAPSMPQFRNLLAAVTIESEVISESDDDEHEDDDEVD